MKRFLTIALLLLAGLTVSAQEGWRRGHIPGDALLNIAPQRFYNYSAKTIGSFYFFDLEGWTFNVTTDNGYFDVRKITYNDGREPVFYVNATIGLFNKDGNLLDKVELQMQTTHQDFRLAWVNEQWSYTKSAKKQLRQMIKAIRTGEGYLRVVIPRRRMENFDLKVPPLPVNPLNR